MHVSRYLFVALLGMMLALHTGCQKKGIPCPKPSKNKTKVKTKGGKDFESVRVPTDKSGRVKKRNGFLFF